MSEGNSRTKAQSLYAASICLFVGIGLAVASYTAGKIISPESPAVSSLSSPLQLPAKSRHLESISHGRKATKHASDDFELDGNADIDEKTELVADNVESVSPVVVERQKNNGISQATGSRVKNGLKSKSSLASVSLAKATSELATQGRLSELNLINPFEDGFSGDGLSDPVELTFADVKSGIPYTVPTIATAIPRSLDRKESPQSKESIVSDDSEQEKTNDSDKSYKLLPVISTATTYDEPDDDEELSDPKEFSDPEEEPLPSSAGAAPQNQAVSVPEPSTFLLLAMGLVGFVVRRQLS